MKTQALMILLVFSSWSAFAQSSRRNDNDNSDSRHSSTATEQHVQSDNHQNNHGSTDGNRTQDNHQVTQDNHGNNHGNHGSNNDNHGNNHGNQGSYNDNHGNQGNRYTYGHDRSNNEQYNHNNQDWDRTKRTDHIIAYDVRRPERTDRYYREHMVYRSEPLPGRRIHYDYRVPVRRELIWSFEINRDYRRYYPEISNWRYNVGAQIRMIPAYDSWDNIGEVNTVYGKVVDAFYDNASDQYYIYFGDYFPNQNFSVVIPGVEARYFGRWPDQYFIGQNMAVTGYISKFDNRPEIVVRNARQVEVY